MISREDASDSAKEYNCMDARGKRYFDMERFLTNLYGSIGTCGECKHFSKFYGQCNLHLSSDGQAIPMLEKDFCSYFERKA